MILKGTIYITDDLEVIYNANMNTTKIISLDEDDILKIPDMVSGTVLLPPMEAKIAEADGNELAYDAAYSNHLLLPPQQKFVAALISFLYKGGNLLLFLPEIGYNNTLVKLVYHIQKLYGIHIGKVGDPNPVVANCYYEERCTPMWLNLIYVNSRVIGAYEYLINYPLDAPLNNNLVINLLLMELDPYGSSINERLASIEQLRKKLHVNPYTLQVLYNTD